MARIAGVDLQDNWKVDYALTKIKGIGWALSKKILKLSKIDDSRRLSDLKARELSTIASGVEKQLIGGELDRMVRSNISRLRQISSYRGLRHARSLPARGQRTKSNARTKRGKRKTVGAFKKEMLSKVQQAKSE
jgi:small subunit ribosomal protein S13